MMIHIRGNHTFFRLHVCYFFKNLCAVFFVYCTSKYHPNLACIINLSVRSTYKQSGFRIQKIFFCCFCFGFFFLCKLCCFFGIPKDFSNFTYLFRTINIYALHRSLLVQAISPVDKCPEAFAADQKIFLVKLFSCKLHLAVSTFAQVTKSLHVTGSLIVIKKCGSVEHRVVQKEGIIHNKFRLCKQAGAYHSVISCLACKQVKTSFYQVIVFKCIIICQCLKSQVSQPQSAVTFRAVFKYRLHAVH